MHFDSLPRPLPSQEERREIRFNDLTLQRNTMPYIELHACSAFSFLRGASFPEQLAETAAELAMPAMALLDRNGVYGAQRFSVVAREQNIRPIIGCELSMEDGGILPVLVENRNGYKNLCELLTEAHLRSEKGKCAIQWDELPQFAEGLVALLGSACVSRAGEGVLAIANFSRRAKSTASGEFFEKLFRRDAETNTRDACATQPEDRAQFLIQTLGRENVFVEIQRHFIRGEERVNQQLVDQRGPYLASGNWWDEKIWSRSEWDLQLENNVLVRCHQSPPSLKLPPTLASARRAGVVGIEKWEVDGIYD